MMSMMNPTSPMKLIRVAVHPGSTSCVNHFVTAPLCFWVLMVGPGR